MLPRAMTTEPSGLPGAAAAWDRSTSRIRFAMDPKARGPALEPGAEAWQVPRGNEE